MINQEVIQPSTRPWASPIVLVMKKDRSTRFCVDYRRLNSLTTKDSHPLQRINVPDALTGSHYFTTLDLVSGNWQIEMDEPSRDRTAIISYSNLYEFQVMPFGLNNAPATFQRLMEAVLLWKICRTYLDDEVIFSKTFEDHLQHIATVSDGFRQANIKLKPSKCYLAHSEGKYLRHIVSAEGIRPDPDKIEAVKDFPAPRNVKGVRNFWVFVTITDALFKIFAKIAAPLNKLTPKNILFRWDDKCAQAFSKLKHVLTTAPILAYPDFTVPCELYVDTSLDGIGMCLGQHQNDKEVAIAYAGRDFNTAERNYSATEREALALVEGIKHFQT